MQKPLILFLTIAILSLGFTQLTLGQSVDIKNCPQIYKRNNGNGQQVTEFAPNISPTSIYALSALTKLSQGNFTFGWGTPILFPPVVSKTWITTNTGENYLDWAFGNNSSGSPFNPPGIPVGDQVKYTFYLQNLPTAGWITVEFTDPVDALPLCTCTYPLTPGTSTDVQLVSQETLRVSSGSDGGLESKSLGSAVVQQVYEKYSNGNQPLDYRKKEELRNFRKAKTSGLELSSLVPDEQVLGTGFKGYMTSPTELVEITNAEEVISVDYLSQENNLATFFATKTSNSVYEHSKYVCDRLKGSEILSIDSIEVGNYKLIRSLLKPEKGLNEYAVSFSVSKNQSSNNLHIQSAWLLDDYQGEETFYNFQFWSADGKLLQRMIENVLSRLDDFGDLSQSVSKTSPGIFVSKTSRDKNDPQKIILKIWNRTYETSALLQLTSKQNESSANPEVSTQQVELTPMGITNVSVEAKDYAEVAIDVISKNQKNDYLYQSDGIWAYYLPLGGQLLNYQIENGETSDFNSSVYPIFRNVEFKSTGTDYATVYKTIKGGARPADLSDYTYLKFKGSGSGKITIRLIKESVENYEEQYSYSFDLTDETKSFSIPLSKFSSVSGANKGTWEDVAIISFTSESKNGIEMNFSQIKFSNEKEILIAKNQEIKAFPNPFQGSTSVVFDSQYGGTMQMEIFHIESGKIIKSQAIDAQVGRNQLPIELESGINKGIFLMKIWSKMEILTTKLLAQ